MPYKNVHYIKIMLELLDDERFIQGCNESQKLDYILWLCMAGLTQNNAKNNPQWFKTRFNLSKNIEEISQNLHFLSKTFSKMMIKNGEVKFRNFKKLHNPIWISEGTPKDKQRNAQNIIEYNKIIIEYIKIKGYPVYLEDGTKDKPLEQALWKRNIKVLKNLLILAKGNAGQVVEAMHWFGGICDKKGFSWTLETIEKWFPEFLVKGKTSSYDKLLEEFGLKKEKK